MKNQEVVEEKFEAEEEFKPGFTKISFIAVLFAIFVFIPAIIYLQLMVGSVSIPVAWFTLVLFLELGRAFGFKISKQEAFMIYVLSAAEMYIPLGFVYNAYMKNSSIFAYFGLTNEVPSWVAPPLDTKIFEMRTLFNPAWTAPYVVTFTAMVVSIVMTLAVAFLSQEVFIEEENLPFPMQQVGASAIITITEGKERRMGILFSFALVGFFWGFIVYAFPFVYEAWTGRQLTIVPIPWADLTPYIERAGLHGAILGIATDLWPIAATFVLPLNVVVQIIVSSFAVWFFGNWLTVAYNLSPTPWWEPGLSIGIMYQRSILYVWAAPIVGLTLAAGLVPALRYPRALIGAFSRVLHPTKVSRKRIEAYSLRKVFLFPYVVCGICGIAFFVLLAPEFFSKFFFIVVPLIFGMPLISSLIAWRMVGQTGIGGLDVGTITRVIYLSTGYSHGDMWFVPNMWTTGGGGYLETFKVAQLTKTSIRSFIKGYCLLLPIAIATGFLFTQMFWNMAPIPSGRYPGAEIFWKVNVTYQALWMKGYTLQLFQPTWIAGAFAVGAAIFAVGNVTGLPLSIVSLAAGSAQLTPFAVTYLIGVVVTLILSRVFKKDWWEMNKNLASAGLLMGEGIAVSLSVAVSLVIHSLWMRPF